MASARGLNALFPRAGQVPDLSNASIPPSVFSVLFNSLPLVVLSYGFWDQYSDYLQSQSLSSYAGHVVENYDFIIVGGGSAGSVLANRLSADPYYQVLLLEYGGNPNPMQAVPGYLGALLHTEPIDFDYYTVPQRNACLALNEQRSFWPRGKGLGGCSNLNAMFYQRGNPNDYDRWAELSGNDQWKFDSILRNFKNIEDYHGQYYDEKWHSQDGHGVYVSISDEAHLYPEFLQAGQEMGYPIQDVNGRQEASFSRLDVTIKDGRRFSAYPAFIKPVIKRKNLKIYRYSHVVRIEIDENNRAYGVTYNRHGVQRFVRANKEVIVSAGAIDTPKLLMLSGIGPKRHLEKLGIECKVNLPVGRNLQDHIMANIGPFILETPLGSFNPDRDVTLNMISDYFTNHKGMLSTPMLNNAVAYVYSSVARDRMKSENLTAAQVAPDIQLILWPTAFSSLSQLFEKSTNVKSGYLKPYFEASKGRDGFFVNVMLAKYYSRGEIKLASANPMDKPIINPRYLTHPNDIRILKDGLNFTVTMVETTKAFQRHGARLANKHLPGCEHFALKSDDYYECFARHMTLTVYHHSGTCTMGKGVGDPKAVVDPNLRVLKTKGLRVVDASIIPEVPNANINSVVFMLADKISEVILEYWGRQERLTSERRR